MYLGFCALRRFEAEGRREEDVPFVLWATEHAQHEVQTAFEGIYRNFEGPLGPLKWLLRGPGAWWCRVNPLGRPPSDRLGSRVAVALRSPGTLRERLTSGVFLPADPTQALGRLERAFALVAEAAPLLERIARASRQGNLPAGRPEELLDQAVAAGVVTAEQAGQVRRATEARRDAIQVDSFPLEEYVRLERREAAPAEAVPLS
jgi:acyl-CoA dehydrogenase